MFMYFFLWLSYHFMVNKVEHIYFWANKWLINWLIERSRTCTRASLRSSRSASSSRVNTSGYCVLSKARSSWCSWNVVNVVRLRRTFRDLSSSASRPPPPPTFICITELCMYYLLKLNIHYRTLPHNSTELRWVDTRYWRCSIKPKLNWIELTRFSFWRNDKWANMQGEPSAYWLERTWAQSRRPPTPLNGAYCNALLLVHWSVKNHFSSGYVALYTRLAASKRLAIGHVISKTICCNCLVNRGVCHRPLYITVE